MNIRLRTFESTDTDLLVKYLNNKQVTQYITDAVPTPYTPSDGQWWVEHSKRSQYTKAIEYQGKLVGCISAQVGSFEYYRSAELGYWIGQEYWNKGIATSAVKQFSDRLFSTTHIVRLFVSVVSLNTASIRVLEKNGFRSEGIRKSASYKNNQFFDECVLAKISLKNHA
ncbi:GNAT family protein [Aliiglaciecola sp. LCG003]|uniref:GNAT family N-acetyltransferase n=1 Tax=Aliiglaciecola sp. LCG003 TaxID=3053655 RepID=UPI0025735E3C|nr:GNAT family protein [Aliiglaciecola sp. LCG003]WJG08597.1 GNAT family protein [Aliiglaciecola sp. LCG003]